MHQFSSSALVEQVQYSFLLRFLSSDHLLATASSYPAFLCSLRIIALIPYAGNPVFTRKNHLTETFAMN